MAGKRRHPLDDARVHRVAVVGAHRLGVEVQDALAVQGHHVHPIPVADVRHRLRPGPGEEHVFVSRLLDLCGGWAGESPRNDNNCTDGNELCTYKWCLCWHTPLTCLLVIRPVGSPTPDQKFSFHVLSYQERKILNPLLPTQPLFPEIIDENWTPSTYQQQIFFFNRSNFIIIETNYYCVFIYLSKLFTHYNIVSGGGGEVDNLFSSSGAVSPGHRYAVRKYGSGKEAKTRTRTRTASLVRVKSKSSPRDTYGGG